jgi:hypothetical protein
MRGAGFNQGEVCAGMKHPGSARSDQGRPRWRISIQGFETRLAFPPVAQHADDRTIGPRTRFDRSPPEFK